MFRVILKVGFLLGISLLMLNLYGLTVPLRSSEITANYADFARPATLPYDIAKRKLEKLSQSTDHVELIEEGTRIFHNGMAHIAPNDIEEKGFSYYRMRVPAWENFVLFVLSYLKPDTYMDYEFCSYSKALERGTGRCGQQSLALVGYLHELGVDTGFVRLGGHAMATARVGEKWFMMDPDFGGVIPFSLVDAEKKPESVRPYYWSAAADERKLYRLFGPKENKITMGGPEQRWPRVCVIEKVSYFIKWVLPIVLILLGGVLVFFIKPGQRVS